MASVWFSRRSAMQTGSNSAGAATNAAGMQTTTLRCPFARSVVLDAELPSAAVIASWLSSRNADDFPYDKVVTEFHRVGKHLVPTDLLEALAGVRAALP